MWLRPQGYLEAVQGPRAALQLLHGGGEVEHGQVLGEGGDTVTWSDIVYL